MSKAVFNHLTEALNQQAEGMKFLAHANLSLGKADQTMNEVGDTTCRPYLESSKRSIDRAMNCLTRMRQIVEQIERIRPYPEEAPRLVSSRPEVAPHGNTLPRSHGEASPDRRDAPQVCNLSDHRRVHPSPDTGDGPEAA